MTGITSNPGDGGVLEPGGRAVWAALSDAELLRQCGVDTYRASGPGGQKRNKTSSAVRIRHPPTGLLVIAEESRSQHENKARALRRLRKAFYLKLRERLPASFPHAALLGRAAAGETSPGVLYVLDRDGRLALGAKEPMFWPAVGLALDVLGALDARVAEAATALGITTGNLIDFLQTDPKVWEQANHLRARRGQKPLR